MNITLDESVLEVLDKLSKRMGISRSAVIATAVMQYDQQADTIKMLPAMLEVWMQMQQSE